MQCKCFWAELLHAVPAFVLDSGISPVTQGCHCAALQLGHRRAGRCGIILAAPQCNLPRCMSCFRRHTSRFLVIWLTFMPVRILTSAPIPGESCSSTQSPLDSCAYWSDLAVGAVGSTHRMMLLVADEHHRPTQQPQVCATQFTLWHACGWGTVPASIAIAFLLLGIEEIGVQIEGQHRKDECSAELMPLRPI